MGSARMADENSYEQLNRPSPGGNYDEVPVTIFEFARAMLDRSSANGHLRKCARQMPFVSFSSAQNGYSRTMAAGSWGVAKAQNSVLQHGTLPVTTGNEKVQTIFIMPISEL